MIAGNVELEHKTVFKVRYNIYLQISMSNNIM